MGDQFGQYNIYRKNEEFDKPMILEWDMLSLADQSDFLRVLWGSNTIFMLFLAKIFAIRSVVLLMYGRLTWPQEGEGLELEDPG